MAKEITHPLQSKVDEIIDEIEKELCRSIMPGDQISMTRFESIRNKTYVRRRLEERGFIQIKGSALRYVYKTVVDVEVPSIKKTKKYSQEDVLNRFKKGAISNEGLKPSDRNKLSVTVSHLRKLGLEIEAEKRWSKNTGKKITIYKMKTSNSSELSEAC